MNSFQCLSFVSVNTRGKMIAGLYNFPTHLRFLQVDQTNRISFQTVYLHLLTTVKLGVVESRQQVSQDELSPRGWSLYCLH